MVGYKGWPVAGQTWGS